MNWKTTVSEPMSRAPRRWILAAVFFFVYLGVQAALPLKRFFREDSIDLGWTMYSGAREVPAVSVRLEDGTSVPHNQFADVYGAGRVVGTKVDEARWVPRAVCPKAGVVGVELVYERSGRRETIPCP